MDDDGGDDGLLDDQAQPAPEVHPPGVLQPGKLGLAGIRPDKVDGHVTAPCSYGSMHGYTWGELFFLFCSFFSFKFHLLIVTFFLQGEGGRFESQISRDKLLSGLIPGFFNFFHFFVELHFFSRYHVAGSVGSFVCDVTFRHGRQR